MIQRAGFKIDDCEYRRAVYASYTCHKEP